MEKLADMCVSVFSHGLAVNLMMAAWQHVKVSTSWCLTEISISWLNICQGNSASTKLSFPCFSCNAVPLHVVHKLRSSSPFAAKKRTASSQQLGWTSWLASHAILAIANLLASRAAFRRHEYQS